jgi:hypothetical protein
VPICFQDLRATPTQDSSFFFNQAFDPPVIPSFEKRFKTTIFEIIRKEFLYLESKGYSKLLRNESLE